MTGWLAEKSLLVIGTGEDADIVAAAGRAAGATVRQDCVWRDTIAMDDVDLLVLAGIFSGSTRAVDVDLEGWRQGLSGDIDGRFLATAAFARACLATRRPGVVLMLVPAAGDAARATANAAIDNLVKSLAVEWARDDIRINAVISRRIAADGRVDAAAHAALGNLATWLLSDFAGYVSGSAMGIDETADASHSVI